MPIIFRIFLLILLASTVYAEQPVYDRKDWPQWIDEDKDCQNTRAEILIETSLIPVKFKRNKGCVVTWGEWIGPYTNRVFTKASDLDIDHIVPLKWAHDHGGAAWNREKKRAFANDPHNLLAVFDSINRIKGAKGPTEWMPPNIGYWCEYLLRWDFIVKRYGLDNSDLEPEFSLTFKSSCSKAIELL